MKKLVLCAIFLAIFIAPGIIAAERSLLDSIAVITDYEGSAAVKPAGAREWDSAEIGMPVYEGDEFRTRDSSYIEITFDNASIVRLDDNTTMKLSELKRQDNTAKTMFDLTVGRLLAVVEKLANQESSFQVRTKMALAAVKGTKLIVQTGKNIHHIGVFKGSVNVHNLAYDSQGGPEKETKTDKNTGAGSDKAVLKGLMNVLVNEGEETGIDGKTKELTRPGKMKELLKFGDEIGRLGDELEKIKRAHKEGRLKELLKERAGKKGQDEKRKNRTLKRKLRKNLAATLKNSSKDLSYVIAEKRSDLHLGKTVIDQKGRRVRMEEYVLRPAANKIDFLSVSQREGRMDYVKSENIFNKDTGLKPGREIWYRSWTDYVSAEDRIYRTNEIITFSNCRDKVVHEYLYSYRDGMTSWSQPGGALIKDVEALWVNGKLKEHRVFGWTNITYDDTYTYTMMPGPGDQLGDPFSEPNVIKTNGGNGLLDTREVRNYSDGSSLTTEYFFINDYGQAVKSPATNAGVFDLIYNTNLEIRLTAPEFSGRDIDIVSKMMWHVSIDRELDPRMKFNEIYSGP